MTYQERALALCDLCCVSADLLHLPRLSRWGSLCCVSHLFAVAHFHLAGGAEPVFTHHGAYIIANREEEENHAAAAPPKQLLNSLAGFCFKVLLS